ncbi:MAG: hypothetical protein PHQ03_11845 [Methylococcales bacterium]|nr:hypothetical protein [Methylococcales bacterium]
MNIDLSHTPKQAFIGGFFKGLCAPMTLYRRFEMPPLQKVDEIKSPYSNNLCEGLAQDWVKIGNDFKRVVGNYEPAAN